MLLLDEPCSALDPISTGKIEELIDELKDDYTVVIVTHNMQQAARVVRLHRLHVPGRPDRVRPDRRELFMKPKQQGDRGLHHRPVRLIGPSSAPRALHDATSTSPASSTPSLAGISTRVLEMGRPGRGAGGAGDLRAGELQRRDRPRRSASARSTRQPDGDGDRPRPVVDHRAAPADRARPAPADRGVQDHRQPGARRRRGRAHRPHRAAA